MNLSALSNVDFSNAFQVPSISSELDGYVNSVEGDSAFEALFNSAIRMVNGTNDYSNAAEEEEIKFSLGETDSVHDLQIAQQKANIALQYTVAVRDTFMSSYREIMNLQF